MSYSQGVLIHNFNEDRFGQDLAGTRSEAQVPYVSVSHTVHHWKQPGQKDLPMGDPRQGCDKHIFFGHTGDMTDPHRNLQKSEYGTTSTYFMQDPKKISANNETLTADAFSQSDWHLHVAPPTSHLAAAQRAKWGDMRQSHALPPSEQFMTTHLMSYTGQQHEAGDATRTGRPKGEFTYEHEKVKLLRSTNTKTNSPLSSAGAALAGTAEGKAVAARAIKLTK